MRGPIATRTGLIGSLFIVMMQKALGHLLHLLKRLRQLHAQTLLTTGAMKTLDVGIFVWPLGWADIGFNPHTQQEAQQG